MEITWQGHSSLRLVSRDVALLTDPFPNSPTGLEADIVTVSSDYPNHSAHGPVQGEPRLIQGPGQYEVMGYNITGIGTALNDAPDSRRVNTVYVIRSEGLAVCHLGSLNQRLAAAQLNALGSVDALIVPAGGGGALGAKDIANLINALSPGVVIPVHFDPSEGEDGLGAARALLSEMNVEPPDAQIRLNVTQNNIPREMRVTLLRDMSGD